MIEQLADVIFINGIAEYIRSDNDPEFIEKELRKWLGGIAVKTAFIEPGSPREKGYYGSLNGTFKDNLLYSEVFYNLKEARVIVGELVKHYNQIRPHSYLGYKPPVLRTLVLGFMQKQAVSMQRLMILGSLILWP